MYTHFLMVHMPSHYSGLCSCGGNVKERKGGGFKDELVLESLPVLTEDTCLVPNVTIHNNP